VVKVWHEVIRGGFFFLLMDRTTEIQMTLSSSGILPNVLVTLIFDYLRTHYYVFVGGYSGNKVEQYNLDTQEWNSLPILKIMRESPAIVYYKNKIYILGGGQTWINAEFCEVYDYELQQWNLFPSLIKSHRNSIACIYESNIYLFGGCLQDTQQCSEIYSFETNKWILLDTSLLSGRSHMQLIVYQDAIYLFWWF